MSVDDILDLIDAGLQSSPESGCHTDVCPDRCARCRRHDRPADGDLCPGCRAFLLEDSAEDPMRPTVTPEDLEAVRAALAQVWERMVEAVNHATNAICSAFEAVDLDEVKRTFDAVLAQQVNPEGQPRERERALLDQHRRAQRRTNRLGPRPGR